MSEEFIDTHAIVHQLTQWHVHRETYLYQPGPPENPDASGTSWTSAHSLTLPPLITQLITANTALSGVDVRPAPGSRPAANIDALDTYTHIDLAASRWIRDLGEDDPLDTIGCVRKLYALCASAHHCGKTKATTDPRTRKIVCCTVHDIERDIRRWWIQARVVSGWDTPAWAPNNTCPACNERRTLRIRPDDKSAMCTNCRETWNTATIGLLAEHVRHENGDPELEAS